MSGLQRIWKKDNTGQFSSCKDIKEKKNSLFQTGDVTENAETFENHLHQRKIGRDLHT